MKSKTKRRIIAWILCMVMLLGCGMSTLAEGESEDPAVVENDVQEETAEETDTVEEAQAEAQPYEGTYEDDTITIKVSAEAGIVPEGAELKVTPIEKKEITDEMTEEEKAEVQAVNDQYDLTEKKLNEDSEEKEETMEGFLAYDISFLVNGEEVEPSGDVKVVMDFKEAAIPEGVSEDAEVTVKHLKDEETAEDGVVVEDMSEKAEVQATEKAEVEKVELTSDTFSTFTITWTTSGYSITVHYVNEKYQEITSDNVQSESVELEEGKEVSLSKYFKTISGYTFGSTIKIGKENNAPTIAKVRVNDTGSLQYSTSESGTNWQNWGGILGYDVYLVYTTTSSSSTAEIETIDNKAENITINLFDYNVEANNEWSKYADRNKDGCGYTKGINAEHSLKFLSGAPNTNNRDALMNQWTGGSAVRAGIVKNDLTDGYPVLSSGNESLAYLFNDDTVRGKTSYLNTNHLLTKDAEGYFSFDSDTNYAQFNTETNNFTVYSNPYRDTQKWTGTGSSAGYASGLKGFYPFDPFDSVINKYTGNTDGSSLFNDGLWGLAAGNANHYFGMTMSATFYYLKDGMLNGQPMVFEFSGDDDVWVFIDGKLVLDLGGIHDRSSGKIDFSTGKVYVNDNVKINNMYTSIFDKQFDPYTQHTIKFFYLERGNNASNCKLKFNLPTIPADSVMVAKEVTGEDGTSVNYAQNVDFQFNITKKDSTGKMQPVANTNYEIRNTNNQVIGSGTTDKDGNFTLKHGQMAIFKEFIETDVYEVKEIGASLNEGYEVTIDKTDVVISNPEEGGDEVTLQSASTGEQTVHEFSSAVFKNRIDKTATLSVTKRIKNGSEAALADKSFDIRVWIDGVLYKGTYDIGEETKTATNGNISLTGNQTATISGLPYGVKVKVEEVSGRGYYPEYSISGAAADSKVPTYDANGWITDESANNASCTVAGDCEVTVRNREVEGGSTSVKVEKEWDSAIADEYKHEVTVTLYSGEEGSGEPVVRGEDNPATLNSENSWTKEWEDLPGDTNYYVVESVKEFQYDVSYSYDYSINSDSVWITTCNTTQFALGANGFVAINIGSDWVVWTTEPVASSAQKQLVDALNNDPNKKANKISYESTFIYGNVSYQHPKKEGTIDFKYENGNLDLNYNLTSNWSLFGCGTYDKTVTATVTNSIKEDAQIDIPVEKVWQDGNSENRPTKVEVQLYRQIRNGDETEVPNAKLILTAKNDWKGSFSALPYWSGNDRIIYTVKEVTADDKPIEDSGYQSSITGNADDGFVITNTLAWQLVKISSETGPGYTKLYLGGAEFTADGGSVGTYYGRSESDTGVILWYETKDFSGTPIGKMLPDGTYTITEDKAPAGYKATDDNGTNITWAVSIQNGYPTSIKCNDVEVDTGKEGETNTFYFKNEALYSLPEAGGPGIYLYMLGGVLLMMAGSLLVYKKRSGEVLGR